MAFTRRAEAARMQSSINVTPLVDVVLVLLIIFMVMAPQLRKGPNVDLPETAKPGDQPDLTPVRVSINDRGGMWIDDEQVSPERFGASLLAAAHGDRNAKVVIQGDAKLSIGDIRRAMLAIEAEGFHGVGLLAQRAGGQTRGE
jgi:biopolymer transport protein TolR